MKQSIFLFSAVFSLLISAVYAQDRPKIAVYCSGGDEQTKSEVWARLHAAIGTNRKEVLKDVRNIFEQATDNTSRINLSDDEIMNIVKRNGCKFLIIAKIGSISGMKYITSDFINLQSNERIKNTGSYFFYTNNELIDACNKTIDELLGTDKSYAAGIGGQTSDTVNFEQQNTNFYEGQLTLEPKWRKIYLNGKKLTKNEVRNKMSANNDALQLYNKGISLHNTGNWLVAGGACLYLSGTICGVLLYTKGKKELGNAVFYPMFTVGVGLSFCGLVFEIKGYKKVMEAVSIYNQRGYASQVEFSFGASLNRVGFTVNF